MTPTRTTRRLVLFLVLLALAVPARSDACNLPSEIARTVTKVLSADTLLLDDGSEVVLVGAMPPVSLDQPSPAANTWPPASLSQQKLESLVGGKSIDLAFSGRRLDRYGRHLAHVFLSQQLPRKWVQGELIASGFARAYALPGNAACFDEMLAEENRARSSQTGHWGSGIYQDRNAHAPVELARFHDTFQTVEGRIERTAKFQGQQVFDFTTSGRSGFSIWIARPQGTRRKTSAVSPQELVGKRVRVRGWLEQRRAPRLTLDDISQIEILDTAPLSTPPDNTAASVQPIPIPATHR